MEKNDDKINDYLNRYLETENNIDKLNSKIHEFKELQKKRQAKIFDVITKNNSGYEVNGFVFQTKEINTKESITLKYLEHIISTYYKDDINKAEELLSFIKDNRKVEHKNVLDIKKPTKRKKL
jgi:hypothetical protein